MQQEDNDYKHLRNKTSIYINKTDRTEGETDISKIIGRLQYLSVNNGY